MLSCETATDVYEEAKSEYNAHLKDLSEASQPRKWPTLKTSLFGVEVPIPPLMKPDSSITNSPIEKATLLADYFNSKQSLEDIELPFVTHHHVLIHFLSGPLKSRIRIRY